MARRGDLVPSDLCLCVLIGDWNERGRVEHRLKPSSFLRTFQTTSGTDSDAVCLAAVENWLEIPLTRVCLRSEPVGTADTGFYRRVETVNSEFASMSEVLVAQREASDAISKAVFSGMLCGSRSLEICNSG